MIALLRGIRLRPATVDDAPLRRRAFSDARAALLSLLPPPLVALQRDAWSNSLRLRFPGAQDYVLEDPEGTAVGVITLHEGDGALRIVDLTVLAPFRGRGYGTAAVAEVCRRADVLGVPTTLSVAAGNAGALRLYERLGFEPAGAQDARRADVELRREAVA